MRIAVSFACVILSVGWSASRRMPDTSSDVAALERKMNDALTRGDWATLEALAAEDLIFTDADGAVSGKSEQVSAVKSGDLKLRSIEMSDPYVKAFENVAVATGRLVEKGHYKGTPVNGAYRFTDVWAKRNGKWEWVVGQETQESARK